MIRYLNPELVKESFERLSSKSEGGKSHQERTSAILYFLAFDAVCRILQKHELDLDSEKTQGRNNRKQLELEFTKLVHLDHENGQTIQFLEFGKIDSESTTPEKRISANFFTVPLKKATTASKPFYYPSRPRAPLLMLGPIATKATWGITQHKDFQKNIFTILSTARSSTPAYDLAVVIFRNSPFLNTDQDLFSGLTRQLADKFTKEVASLFQERISKEKLLLRSPQQPFLDHYINFAKSRKRDSLTSNNYIVMTKEQLIEKILELETEIERLKKLPQEETSK